MLDNFHELGYNSRNFRKRQESKRVPCLENNSEIEQSESLSVGKTREEDLLVAYGKSKGKSRMP